MRCQDAELKIPFYACEELEAAERAALEAHVADCAACRGLLEKEQRLLALLADAGPDEPSATLLGSCRNELADALDLVPARRSLWQRLRAYVPIPEWWVLHPAWGAALCLLVGIAAGVMIPEWAHQHSQVSPPEPLMTISGQDPRNIVITGFDLLPGADSQTPSVELHGTAEQSVVVRGTPDDGNVKRLLADVVRNDQRFDPGLRLDSVELLRTRTADEEVRTALCHAARHDRNPGVRLKALEALRGLGQDEQVRQIWIDALLHDKNPGVRVEAINALRAIAEQGVAADRQLLEVLQDRMQRDPSTYVRLQSAAAIRQLGPRATY